MKRIIITEEQVERIFTKRGIQGLEYEDELMEYAKQGKDVTGLNVDIYVDDGGAYIRNGYPLRIYVPNGYGNTNEFFHIDVSNTPNPPSVHCELDEDDMNAILCFIEINADILRMFANEEISHVDFLKSMITV